LILSGGLERPARAPSLHDWPHTISVMVALCISFFISLVATLLIVRLAKGHAQGSMDTDTAGPQKFHVSPVPRVGGVGIVLAIAASLAFVLWYAPGTGSLGVWLLLCSAPAFCAGLAEDLTKNVSPRRRLFFTAVSAALAVWMLDSVIDRTSIPGLDWVVSFPVGAALVTVFAVAGVANAVNIIDGFNGLAAMCAVMILSSLSYVAYQAGDPTLGLLALAGIGALLGFFVWNFPAGLIFLGDGGAYFVGFFTAEVAILLVHRNAEVSPMFPLLVCIYPIFETVFSIYRKRFLRGMSPGVPDGVHFHMLVYRRLMRWAVGNRTAKALTRRNSLTSPYLWLLCMFSVVPAMVFWDNTFVLALFICLFALTYVVMYWRIVRFKAPRWLIYRR
jgi:UDP-N-acetylmuramyl pentapeptide phosphotransferase/UDP-N-acetylglucosamine-1-phosphate transferase